MEPYEAQQEPATNGRDGRRIQPEGKANRKYWTMVRKRSTKQALSISYKLIWHMQSNKSKAD